MAEFVYNNTKNASTSHMFFELKYSYYSHVFFENKADFCSKLYSANKLIRERSNLMSIY